MQRQPADNGGDGMPQHPFNHPEQLEQFLRLVRDHLGRGGKRVRIHDGVATIEGGSTQMGLTNLAQACNLEPRAAWPAIIAEQLALSDETRVRNLALSTFGSPFERLAGQLALRIHPEESMAGYEPHIVLRRDLPGTVTVLVLDLPESVMAVPVPLAEIWGVRREQLFERALHNLDAMEPARWTPLYLPPGMSIDALTCRHAYTTSHALRLERCLPRTGRHGNLIALPNRQVLLSHAIDDRTLLPSLEALLEMAFGMCREGPGSISPHLFWRRPDGAFELQQCLRLGGGARLAASPGFAGVMQQVESDPH